MTVSLALIAPILTEAGFALTAPSEGAPATLLFESETILGFALEFETPGALLAEWEGAVARLVGQHQLDLRRSAGKAWNTYAVLLTAAEADDATRSVLNSVEENLVGMRKIVRDGVSSSATATRALLPLLPFIRSPELPSIDMQDEIRLRTVGLPAEALKAFFSDAANPVALQVIEES